MRLVLHNCCAICGVFLTDFFKNQSEKILIYFYNPNIYPEEEYQKRLESVKKMAEIYQLEFLEEKEKTDYWFEKTKNFKDEPEGGKRCEICFQIRLEKTAQLAKKIGYDSFSTTLGISPYKNLSLINDLGQKIAQKFGLNFITLDEKNKKEFWQRSKILAKKFNFYHQKYCGCLFSFKK